MFDHDGLVPGDANRSGDSRRLLDCCDARHVRRHPRPGHRTPGLPAQSETQAEGASAIRQRLLTEPLKWTPELLASHAIHQEAQKYLLDRNYEAFVRARHQTLDAMEREFVTRWGLDYLSEPSAVPDDGDE